MKKTMTIIWLCLLLTAGRVQGAEPFEPAPAIGPEACWLPAATVMEKIRTDCAGLAGTAFEACFVTGMQKSGASPQAVAFTKFIGSMGYLEEYRKMGPVNIAFVVYPFRANENQGFLLINGAPPVIDVDDLSLLSAEDLRKDPRYPRLKKQYPAVALWQGDRSGREYPMLERKPDGAQRFTVRYRLLNGCHACELAGHVRYAFDFNRTGQFSGTTYLGIEKPPANIGKSEEAFSDPATPVTVTKGQTFALTLRSNPTTGYIWQLAKSPEDGVIQFIDNQYRGDKTVLVGAGGREIWTFKAVGTGETTIGLKYVRPWEKNTASAKIALFKIIVSGNENRK
jgi:predicted secreted protein